MTEQPHREQPIHVFVQGPEGEDFYTSDNLIDCWMSGKYGGVGKRILVMRPEGACDLYAVAADGPVEYRKFTAAFDNGVLVIRGYDESLHTAYAPGQWLQVQGNGLKA